MEDKLNEEKLDETTNEELGASLGRLAMIKCLVFTESNITGRCLAAGSKGKFSQCPSCMFGKD